MRHRYIICFLTILTACSSTDKKNQTDIGVLDTYSTIQANDLSISVQPAKTIIDFLKWYRDNEDNIQRNLFNNASNETDGSTKFYSFNFDGTDKYLTTLLSTGFISAKYADKRREYFKKADQDFKADPSSEVPPLGFDYDLIMLSQEIEENLKHLEKTQVVDCKIADNTALVTLCFVNGNSLKYKLTKDNDKWLIDGII